MTTTEQHPRTASDDQVLRDTHSQPVVAGPLLLADQLGRENHMATVGEDLIPPSDPFSHETQEKVVVGDPNSTISQSLTVTHGVSADGGPNPLVDHHLSDTQGSGVDEGPNHRNGQGRCDTQSSFAVAALTSPPARGDTKPSGSPPSGTQDSYTDQSPPDTHSRGVGVGPDSGSGRRNRDTQSTAAATALTSPAAKTSPTLSDVAPSGTLSSATDQNRPDARGCPVGGAPYNDNGQTLHETHRVVAVVVPTPQGPARGAATPTEAPLDLADPLLELSAAVLDDLERVRIANENRLRQLTRDVDDKDGEERGFGLTLDNPDVLNLAALVRSMRCDSAVVVALIGKSPKTQGCCLEHDAERELTRKLKKHPLGPWFAAQRGVGPKQAARLIAKVGDPFIKPDIYKKTEDGEVYLAETSRPRLVSELWSYTGYGDSREQVRRKGHKANWSSPAKMRAFNIIDSCVKQVGKTCEVVKDEKGAYLYAAHAQDCACSPYRLAYDRGRAKYKDSVHPWECDRCSPKGKPPAPAGSPRSPKHQHQAAVRLATKEFLRDLWREAARLHGHPDGHNIADTHRASAVGAPSLASGRAAADTQKPSAAGESA